MRSCIRVLKREQFCREICECKKTVGKKTAGLRSGKFSDVNSECLKVLVHVKKFSSKTYLMKVNDIGTKQTAYVVDSNIEINKRFESLICEGDEKFDNQQIPLQSKTKEKVNQQQKNFGKRQRYLCDDKATHSNENATNINYKITADQLGTKATS